jgi:diaminopimelate decarboxylase
MRSILPATKIAFAVKSNPNLAVLKVLAAEGYGADVVSGGEMERAGSRDAGRDRVLGRRQDRGGNDPRA